MGWRRIAVALFGAAFLYAAWIFIGLPGRSEIRALARTQPVQTGVMRQRQEEARRGKRSLRASQVVVPLRQVSRHLINAVVAAEDPNFFGHAGVDWEAIRESVETNVRKRRFARGGSTITQQLAKNLFFTTHKSVTRKLRELLVAGWLEEDLTKARILEIYLNVIEWGDGVYGCEAAARRYYGKSAADLDPEEAAGLAAMIPSPRLINPRVNPGRHARAQRRVLWLMEHAGYVRRGVSGLGVEPPPEVLEPVLEPIDDSDPPPEELPALVPPPHDPAPPEPRPMPDASPEPPPG
jgi:monofunctional biosynthetic peptidoglycan transglycosylase